MVTRRLVRPIYNLISALSTYIAKFDVRCGCVAKHRFFSGPSINRLNIE